MNQIISNSQADDLLLIDTMGKDERREKGISGLSMGAKVLLANWWKDRHLADTETPLAEWGGKPIVGKDLEELLDDRPTVMCVLRAVESLRRLS